MLKKTKTVAIMAMLTALAFTNISAQNKTAETDSLISSINDGANYVREMFTKSADQMSEEDYAFRPTPEVRSFGEILAHVADTNYWFCATAKGEKPPVSGIEKAKKTRPEIQKALSDSFAYCDEAHAAMSDPQKAKTLVTLMGTERPALAVLIFRSHHSLLHYGNVITYMRIREKVPPSSLPEPNE